MIGLELVVIIGMVLLACRVAAQRLNIAAPVLQLGMGVLLGFIPALRDVHLSPEMVLLLFLPALLFWEAMTTSQREAQRHFVGIVLMSTALVVLTAGAVAAVAHAFGIPWGPAWVLGAAVAPTDATAVGVIARLLPHRDLTALKSESLVNDGTALVIFGLAVGITVGEEQLSLANVSAQFLVSYLGGVAAGLAVAWLGVQTRKHVHEALAANLVFILIPFTAYLLAELIDASGVLAAVTAGLVISRVAPLVGSAEPRRQIFASWTLATFLLNGALFVLVGIEAQAAVRGLTSSSIGDAVELVLAVAATLVIVRLGFLFLTELAGRLVRRMRARRGVGTSTRALVVSGLAGFRGAVSLAAALAIPAVVSSGAPFPDRDLIIFVTFGVIVATLLQGLVLPGIVRWARLPDQGTAEQERRLAYEVALVAALEALPDVATELGTDPALTERVRQEYLDAFSTAAAEDDVSDRERQEVSLRLGLLSRKRTALVRLRNEQRIDGLVLLDFQERFDLEELRLVGTVPPPA